MRQAFLFALCVVSTIIIVTSSASASAAGGGQPQTCHLSNVFGDHMVLQRPPRTAVVWGFAAPNVLVQATFTRNGGTFAGSYSARADATGVWRIPLNPSPLLHDHHLHQGTEAETEAEDATGVLAATSSFDVSFKCSSGESFALNDVLFGEVVLCGGRT